MSDYRFGYLGKKGIFGYLVERLTIKLTKNNVAVSEQTKRDLERLGLKNVEVIPNGIDFEGIRRVRKADEESDVIFAGRLIRDKNVDVLIRAVRLLKEKTSDIKCMIIGDGPERLRLEKLARDLGLNGNVEFKVNATIIPPVQVVAVTIFGSTIVSELTPSHSQP